MGLKVLFLSHAFAPAIGGIETVSKILADAFLQAGHEVRVMTATAGESTESAYPVIRKPSFREMVRQHAWADVVFENNPCLRLGWAKMLFGKPSLVVLQTWVSRIDSDSHVAFSDKVRFRWLARANKVIAISEAVRRKCWPQATVIHNSYDDQLFGILAQERRQDFVFLGRLVSDKGAQLAVEAFGKLAFDSAVAGMENARLTIIGDGPDRGALEALVAAMPDASRFRFIGPLNGNALVEELNRHQFQFIPSIWEEPFGIVALEGIACGLIPIASDGGGLPDAVGLAGVTFKRGQLDSLVAVTAQLLQSAEQQAKYRAAAPAHLIKFATATITRAYMLALESIALPAGFNSRSTRGVSELVR